MLCIVVRIAGIGKRLLCKDLKQLYLIYWTFSL